MAASTALSGCASDADTSNGAKPASAGALPGGDLPLPGSGGDDCSTPEQGCACSEEGSQVACADKTGEGGGYVHCSHGTRRCAGGAWGACEPSGQTTSIKAPELNPNYQIQGWGTSAKCVNNPCNPYCYSYNDDYSGLTFDADSGLMQNNDGGTPGVTLKPDPNGKPSDQVTSFRITPKPQVVVKIKQLPLGQYPVVDQSPQFAAEFICNPTTPTCNPTKPTAASWSLSSYQNMLINNQGLLSVIKPVPATAVVTGKAGGFADQSTVIVEVDVTEGSAATTGVINSFATANQNPSALPLDDFNWLYPYKNTLFPRGLTAPIAQTDYGSLSSSLVKYTLRHKRANGTVDFSWSSINPQSSPPRYSVPQHVWQYFDETSSGGNAELVIQRAAGVSCGAPAGCQDRFYNNKIYRYCSVGYDWPTSRTQCQNMGMDLVKIDDASENAFVGNNATSIAAGSWWIGANDRTTEGQFRWADGSTMPYTAWNSGEPNDYGGNEDCGELYTSSNVWNDNSCGNGRFFICEGSNTASCSASSIRREVVLPIRFSSEPMQGTVYFWEINNGRIAKILDDGTLVQNFLAVPGGRCLACHSVSADGSTLVAQIDGGNGNGTTFKTNGSFVYERGGANQIMGVSPDGYWALWNDWGILSPSNSSTRPVWAYYKAVVPDSQGRLVAPAWSPDGKWIAWSRWDSGSWYVDFDYANLYITPFNDSRPIDVPDDGNCAFGSWGGHLYGFCRLGWDRNSARNYCTSKGAGWDLAKIEDVNENEAIRSMAYGVAQGSYWIGANDQAAEGQFRWADGSTMPFTYWNGGEPNDSGGAEDCTELLTASGRWNDLNCGTGRYFVCERNPDSWNYFGANTTAATPVGFYDTAVYPSFSPDSNYLIFQRADAVRTRGHYGQLWMLDRANVGTQALLNTANTPTTMNASGLTSAVPNQDAISYEPTFSPTESGGYYWAVFVSNRWYGNTIHSSLGDVRPDANQHMKDSGKKQMWVTAIPKNPNLASDPSSPPFWLPGQQNTNENMRGAFSKTACRQTNQACKWDEDCCGFSAGTALCVLDQPVTPAATRHCGSFTPGQCVSTGGSCTDSSQCCKSPDVLECIQGTCQLPVPTPFYTPTPYDRDYEGTCPSGTRVVWRAFSWKAITPGDSSISVSAKTGETDAEVASASWVPLIQLPAAQCAAGYNCGDVSASFKAVVPPVVSKAKLKVRMVLIPTSDNSTPPVLTDWKQEYDCLPSE